MTSFVFSDEYSRIGIHGSTFSFTLQICLSHLLRCISVSSPKLFR
ncbi:unnamed protein product [Brassica oleracea]